MAWVENSNDEGDDMTHSADKMAPDYRTVELPEMITISYDKLMICAKDAEAHMPLFALNVRTLMEQPTNNTGAGK